MGYLGYARLAPDTWIAPRANAELARSLAAESVGCREFLARYTEPGPALAAELWDLDALAAAYREFLAGAEEPHRRPRGRPDARAGLRRPQPARPRVAQVPLPRPRAPGGVLPPDWPGREAARSFDATAASLLPLAREFVDSCLSTDLKTRS